MNSLLNLSMIRSTIYIVAGEIVAVAVVTHRNNYVS